MYLNRPEYLLIMKLEAVQNGVGRKSLRVSKTMGTKPKKLARRSRQER